MGNWTAADIPDLAGKVAVVTGANAGIGYVTALELARKHAKVYLACRNKERGEAAATKIRSEVKDANVVFVQLDLGDLKSCKTCAETILKTQQVVDILINNAGIYFVSTLKKTVDGFESTFGTNHLGHFAFTAYLLPALKKAKECRIVNVTSGAEKSGKLDIDNLDYTNSKYNSFGAYANSKLANLLFSFELQRKYPNFIVTSSHPGFSKTDGNSNGMGDNRLLNFVLPFFLWLLSQPAEMGALPSLYGATAKVEKNGYYGPNGFLELKGYPTKVKSSKKANDPELAKKSWEYSIQKTGVKYE